MIKIKIVILRHAWFLHAGLFRVDRQEARVLLMKWLIKRIFKADLGSLAIYTAPEDEATATANAVSPLTPSVVIIDKTLSEVVEFVDETLDRHQALDGQHGLRVGCQRIGDILAGIEREIGKPLHVTRRRRFLSNQAILVGEKDGKWIAYPVFPTKNDE